jgi:crotonobetainyl-CoA:carnitine CoA-transferase CaiB-like acyl-CoA transferase
MEKLNLCPTSISSIRSSSSSPLPPLIYARLSGYGQFSPNNQIAGHDMTYLAKAGLMGMFRRYNQNNDLGNYQRDKSVVPSNLMADFMAGSYFLFNRILEELVRQKSRRRTIGKNYSNVVVIDGSLANDSEFVFQDLIWRKEEGLLDSHDLCQHPLNAVYQSKDSENKSSYFVFAMNKSEANDSNIQKIVIDKLRKHGYIHSSLILDEIEKVFRTLSYNEITEEFSDFPIYPILNPIDIVNEDKNKHFDGKKRFKQIHENGEISYEPVPGYFKSSDIVEKPLQSEKGTDYEKVKRMFLSKL